MLTESTRDYASMSSIGASIIFADAMKKLARGERYNLGLATGNTMITLYAELAEKFNSAKADISLLSTWNLDEYAVDEHTPVRHDHPLSYWKYMHEMFFSKLDPALGFKEENAHLPDPSDPSSYDPAIAAAGGLDLQLLGIGFNGHIAFNEPVFLMKNGKATPSLPSVGPAPSHYHEYVNACMQGGTTTSPFAWACRMTEWGFLGNLAQLQPGKRLSCKNMK